MKTLFNNRYIILVLIVTIVNFTFASCYSAREITIKNTEDVRILKILLKNGQEIDFTEDELGYAYLSQDEIVRFNDNGKQEIFPLNTVDKIYTEKYDVGKSCLLVLGVGLGIFLVLGLAGTAALGGRGFGG